MVLGGQVACGGVGRAMEIEIGEELGVGTRTSWLATELKRRKFLSNLVCSGSMAVAIRCRSWRNGEELCSARGTPIAGSEKPGGHWEGAAGGVMRIAVPDQTRQSAKAQPSQQTPA